MFDNLADYRLVLASNSPRRQEILKNLGLKFEIQSSKGEETYPPEMEVAAVAEFLAIQKADWFTDFSNNELYLTADTVVIHNDKVLGKPKDLEEAKATLLALSGSEHHVITGFCLKSETKTISKSVTTRVTFDSLERNQINYYVNKFQPLDKAGSYGIQEWIGMIGVSKIEGSYYNVVGMPTHQLFNALIGF